MDTSQIDKIREMFRNKDGSCKLSRSDVVRIANMVKKDDMEKWAAQIMERVILEIVPCSCGPIYTKRGLVAPNCGRCNGPDLEQLGQWLKEYKKSAQQCD